MCMDLIGAGRSIVLKLVGKRIEGKTSLPKSPKQTYRLPSTVYMVPNKCMFRFLTFRHRHHFPPLLSAPEAALMQFDYEWGRSHVTRLHPNHLLSRIRSEQKEKNSDNKQKNNTTCLRPMSNFGVNDQDYELYQTKPNTNSDIEDESPCIWCYFIHDTANTLLLTHSCPHQRLHTQMHIAAAATAPNACSVYHVCMEWVWQTRRVSPSSRRLRFNLHTNYSHVWFSTMNKNGIPVFILLFIDTPCVYVRTLRTQPWMRYLGIRRSDEATTSTFFRCAHQFVQYLFLFI